MICFDREFPEAARELMLGGAELVPGPNACDWNPFRHAQLVSRAGENMLALAMANYAGPGWGGSSMLDGRPAVRRDRPIPGHDGRLCMWGPRGAVRPVRSRRAAPVPRREVWGDAFRRPSAYRLAGGRSSDPAFRRVRIAAAD